MEDIIYTLRYIFSTILNSEASACICHQVPPVELDLKSYSQTSSLLTISQGRLSPPPPSRPDEKGRSSAVGESSRRTSSTLTLNDGADRGPLADGLGTPLFELFFLHKRTSESRVPSKWTLAATAAALSDVGSNVALRRGSLEPASGMAGAAPCGEGCAWLK